MAIVLSWLAIDNKAKWVDYLIHISELNFSVRLPFEAMNVWFITFPILSFPVYG